MRISDFWVVTYPTKESELRDIIFRCTPQQFCLQSKGGLNPEDIYGLYDDHSSAEQKALFLLHRVKIQK
jgi:hypothetical protein